MENLLVAHNRQEFRDWLLTYAGQERECWLSLKRGRPSEADTFYYLDAVEEALCFGWIDSTVKKVEGLGTLQRFSPRSPRSNWTELNKARLRRLKGLGLATQRGLDAAPDLDPESFQIDPDLRQLFEADSLAWKNFQSFPALYQRVRLDTVQTYKGQGDIFVARAQKLISSARENKLIGQWNDYGRLQEKE